MSDIRKHRWIGHSAFSMGALALSTLLAATPTLGASPTQPADHGVTYLPPDMTNISPTQLKHYYKWREKMDWLLAPIHSQADFKRYLGKHAKTGSPLDALPPDARKRFLASLVFHKHGLGGFSGADLKYLSTTQIYKIMSLFGAQNYTMLITDGRFQTASMLSSNSTQPSPMEQQFDKYLNYFNSTLDMPVSQRYPAIKHAYENCFHHCEIRMIYARRVTPI